MESQLQKNLGTVFPEIRKLRSDLYVKIVGPLLVGIELPKSHIDAFHIPQFVIYPLWFSSLAQCLENSLYFRMLTDATGRQLRMLKDSTDASELERNKALLPVSLEGNEEKDRIIQTLFNSTLEPPLIAAPNSFMQALKYQHMLTIESMYDIDKAMRILNQVKQKRWDHEHFHLCGTNVRAWVSEMEQLPGRVNEIASSVRANKLEKKVACLIESGLQ